MPTRRKTQPAEADALSTYRAKRAFDQTPEPGGLAPRPAPKQGGLLIVHMHDATRLHWDLRLEMDGVLKSWAVPKGPSANPTDKRLAVKVEDHPLEYGDFEGVIPEGNYGAGTVIVWDRGIWEPLEDPHEGLEKGKLLFNLKGYKLHGRWTLIKLKKTEKEWLLIKERDEYVSPNPYSNESVLSGLTNDELRNAKQRAEPIKQELEKLGAPAPKRALRVEDTELMLAETREEPFSKEGWLFEVKLDGYRMRAACQDGEPILYSRKGLAYTESFPEIARAVKAIPFEGVILDGELVVTNSAGHPNFNMLQARAKLGAREAKRAAIESPATLYVFDLLAFAGYDLRKLPLVKRKQILRKVLPETGPLRYSEHFEKNGEALYEQVVKLGLEGIMAKKMDSPYRSGRSSDWLKIRADRIDDFVVVGFTKGKGARSGFGSLHVAAYVGDTLIYCGRAGSGFTGAQLDEVSEQLHALVRKTPPCQPPPGGQLPKGPDHTWVEPKLVCDVRYKEMTKDGLLRQSVFLRFRDDKKPQDVVMPGLEARDSGLDEEAAVRAPKPEARAPQEVKFSNLDKIFWPEEKYTKGDLIEYYRSMAPWLLPYLKDRPVVLTRYPDGINGKSFYQKDAPGFVPDWIQTIPIWSEDTQRDIQYFVCNDVETLVYLVNLGTIPLHIWMSRIDDLTKPDWCLIDLDPKDAPFEHVITLAKTMRKLCEEVEMPAFIKTTGKSGLHIMLPLGGQMTYQQCLQFAMLFARLVTDRHPDIATTQRTISKREGKVYVDAFQNRAGQLMVSAYSVRPSPGAPVSMPIEWDEVNGKLHNSNWTIKNARKRMEKLGHDPVVKVLEVKPKLMGVLERLNEQLK
jgi:bifunctional non-homologous end joining protein LigD